MRDPLVGLRGRGSGGEQEGNTRPQDCFHRQAAEKETLGAD
jgi:hypothetical protein